MFSLDLLVLKWIIVKCSQLGAIFMVGPIEGAIMYFGLISLGVITVFEAKKSKNSGKAK